eukprot:1433667-Pyramimonas_sp.AAC.1
MSEGESPRRCEANVAMARAGRASRLAQTSDDAQLSQTNLLAATHARRARAIRGPGEPWELTAFMNPYQEALSKHSATSAI